MDEKLSCAENLTASINLQKGKCSASSLFEFYKQHRTSIQQYIEHCLAIYSHWTTNELDKISHAMTTSLLDPSFIFTTQEKKWIDENPNIFRLYCHQALFSSLISSSKTTVSFDELLIEQRSILVVGDPGSGKTTWTHWLMWKCIQMFQRSLQEIDNHAPIPLPILIHTNDLVKYLDLNSSISFFDYLCRVSIDNSNERTSTFIGEHLVYGHTLIILDGLDTIDNIQKQDLLIDLLIQFLKSPILLANENETTVPNGNRLIITSHSIRSLPGEYFTMYTLTSLSFDMIENFIDNWWNSHCSHLTHETVDNYSNQWNDTVVHLKALIERHSTFKELLSNILILSTICQWMTLQVLVGTSLKQRIHYYTMSVIVLFVRLQKYSLLNQIDQEIFINLLADIAVHLQEYSSSGLIEKFDLHYKCRASLRNHSAQFLTSEHCLIDPYFTLITNNNNLFFLRNMNNYSFLSLPIQHYLACLFLIRTTDKKQSKIEIVVERFLSYMTNSNFREPLLLGLEWISWQWSSEDLNMFCHLLFTSNNDRFNQHLPLGSMLLMTVLFDLEQKPNEKTLKDAFDRFLMVSTNREWFVRFPIFIDYLIDGLNYLPLHIARTWIYHYFQTRDNIERIRSVLNILTNMICFFREIPIWIRNDDHEKYSLNVLQYQSRIDYIQDSENNDLFVIDRLLTIISIIDSNALSPGFVRHSLFIFNIDIQQFSPVFLTILIALYGGLHRFKRSHLDNKDTVVFSPFHMHRDSLYESWLIKYMNANRWTHLPNTDEIEQQIQQIPSEDDSLETIDLFTAWICLKGVTQPWIFYKYMSCSGFQHAIFRFHRLALYLSEFYYVKYDLEVELEAPSTFREDAISIMQQYAQSKKNETCSTFVHCVAVALTRLIIPGGERSLFYSDGSFCPRMLDLNLSDSKLMSDLWQHSDSDIAIFLPLLWTPIRPREVTLLQEKYDSDSVLHVVDGTHPILSFGHLTSFLLSLIPRHFQQLFDRFLDLSPSFPFVCLLGEIVRSLSSQRKGGIRFALLLAILRIHFEKHQWTQIFRGLLTLVTRAHDIKRYFYKFDCFLSDKYGQSPYDDKTLQEDNLLIALFHERQRAEELRKKSTDCLKLYEASISIAILSAALYEQNDQPLEIADEIWLTVTHIRESILRLHAITIIWHLSQTYTTSAHRIDMICQEALAVIDNQQSIVDHSLLFLIWWTTFANIADNRTIAYQVHLLLDHLTINIKTDSIDIQQTICQSLLIALSHDIYPYVRPRICRFIQDSRWSNECYLSNVFQLQSMPLSTVIKNHSNLVFRNPSKSALLASMYLMQLSIDVYHLPTWFEMENTINRQTTIDRFALESIAVQQLSISGKHRIVSKEAARIMTNLFQISLEEQSMDYHSLERLLSQCEFVEKSAQSDVIQWLQYKDHPHLFVFAFHAALLITKYSIDAIQLCCKLLDHPTDEFRQRAQKCLNCVCLLTSDLTRDQFIQLFSTLLHARRTQSTLARETLINIDVRIDSIEYLELIFIWERERTYLLLQSSQSSHYLTHNLELHQQDIGISLFEYVHLQNAVFDVLECLFEHANDRCCQIQRDRERRTIEEQSYLTELVKFIGRDWYSSLMSEMSICEQKFVSCLIALLNDVPLYSTLTKVIVSVLVINRNTVPYVPIFTRNEARQCLKNILTETLEKPLNEQFTDDVLALIIKHYYHTTNDDDEHILIRLQQISSRKLIVTAADIALIHCRSLRRPKPNLDDFLELMNGEYIRLYHALMSIVVDPRTMFTIYSIALDLICTYEDELLPLFVSELVQCHSGQYSNRIRLACALLDRLSTGMHIAIENNEQLKQIIFQSSERNKDDRDCCIRFLTNGYNELTNDVKQMLLLAMWDKYHIQLAAFECVANIRLVNSRTIVEDLYQELLFSKSFQRRYISAMLLVQLAKFDHVSIYEVQRKLTEAINQSTAITGMITHKGKQNLGQALFNLLTQLSFITDDKRENIDDYHKPNCMNFKWELQNIIDADRYASFTFPTMSLSES
ncbi:unnamed protein product [Rotaria sp. Silwood2]|nr:unnamed protein product [Rotaria sp. Silwood2]